MSFRLCVAQGTAGGTAGGQMIPTDTSPQDPMTELYKPNVSKSAAIRYCQACKYAKYPRGDRLCTNIHGLIRELSGPGPLCRVVCL